MNIKNLENLTTDQIHYELKNGAKFVIFSYCISVLIMTFRRSSSIYFIRPGESTFRHGFVYTLISLVLGWWGIPWGPIHTVTSVFSNSFGGKDVTAEVLKVFNSNEVNN